MAEKSDRGCLNSRIGDVIYGLLEGILPQRKPFDAPFSVALSAVPSVLAVRLRQGQRGDRVFPGPAADHSRFAAWRDGVACGRVGHGPARS